MLTRCACLASRQHCVEVALEGKQVYIGYRLGVLAFLNLLPTSTQVPLVHVQVHLGYRLGVLEHGLGLLEWSQWCTWRGPWVLERNRPSKHPKL